MLKNGKTLGDIVKEKSGKNKKVLIIRILVILLCLGVFTFFGFKHIPQIIESRRLAEQRLQEEREQELKEKIKAELLEKTDEDEMEEDKEEEQEKNKTAQKTPATTTPTSCSSSDIDLYKKKFCNLMIEAQRTGEISPKAGEWGEKLNNCGITGFLESCWEEPYYTQSPQDPDPEPEPEYIYSCPWNTVESYVIAYCQNLQKSRSWWESANQTWSCEIPDSSCAGCMSPEAALKSYQACLDRNKKSREFYKNEFEKYNQEATRYRDLLAACNVPFSELEEIKKSCYK